MEDLHATFQDKDGSFFIDRDGRHVINYLRDRENAVLPEDSLDLSELLREAEYYRIEGLIATVKKRIRKAEMLVTQRDLTSILHLEQIRSEQRRLKSKGYFQSCSLTTISDAFQLSKLSKTSRLPRCEAGRQRPYITYICWNFVSISLLVPTVNSQECEVYQLCISYG